MRTKLTNREQPILFLLDEYTRPHGEFCVPFHTLSGEPKDAPETREVRRIVRRLARKGYAELYRGLFTDEGMLCGSGYCITDAGRAALSSAEGERT